jgi:hypothetical protein
MIFGKKFEKCGLLYQLLNNLPYGTPIIVYRKQCERSRTALNYGSDQKKPIKYKVCIYNSFNFFCMTYCALTRILYIIKYGPRRPRHASICQLKNVCSSRSLICIQVHGPLVATCQRTLRSYILSDL